MSKHIFTPHFFVYENKEVKEVSEKEYYDWTSINWHPSHLLHCEVDQSKDEVFLGFLGHYKFTEWQGKPFNVTYFVYGNEVQWLEIYDEYYTTYEEAETRYNLLKENGFVSAEVPGILQAA
jgi:hypothetical protein